MSKKLKLLLAGLLTIISFTGTTQCENQTQELPISLEHYLRKNHRDFQQSYRSPISNFLLPPAQAEIPPRYWKLFSLYISFDHQQKQLKVSWNYIDNAVANSTVKASKNYFENHYSQLLKLANSKSTCTRHVERGMAGPAPQIIRIKYPSSTLSFYARKSGYDGPDSTMSKQSKSRYLCSKELKDLLNFFRKDVVK